MPATPRTPSASLTVLLRSGRLRQPSTSTRSPPRRSASLQTPPCPIPAQAPKPRALHAIRSCWLRPLLRFRALAVSESLTRSVRRARLFGGRSRIARAARQLCLAPTRDLSPAPSRRAPAQVFRGGRVRQAQHLTLPGMPSLSDLEGRPRARRADLSLRTQRVSPARVGPAAAPHEARHVCGIDSTYSRPRGHLSRWIPKEREPGIVADRRHDQCAIEVAVESLTGALGDV